MREALIGRYAPEPPDDGHRVGPHPALFGLGGLAGAALGGWCLRARHRQTVRTVAARVDRAIYSLDAGDEEEAH